MSTTITPNMGLILPTPGQEPGPQYGVDQNQSGTITDGHNHTPGSGVQIPPAGLDISTNLNFQNNSPYNVSSVIFSVPASNSGLTTLYTAPQSGGGITDLFYNDGAGNVIALTKAGEVNATIASIPGESYAGGTFTWKQGAGSTTPANFDIGSVTIRPNVAATSNGVVLGPPSGISSQYNVQLPIVPGVTSIMQLDSSGNMLGTLVPDNSTIVISSQVLQVPASGITTTQLANGAVTRPKLSALGQQISSSCGNFATTSGSPVAVTNLSVSITTSGRPVMLMIQDDGTATTGSYITLAPGGGASGLLTFNRGVTEITEYNLQNHGASVVSWPASIIYMDVIGAGTYTYTVTMSTGAGAFALNDAVLVAYEM